MRSRGGGGMLSSEDDLGYTDKVKQIPLVDEMPVSQPYRRIPPTQFEEVREHTIITVTCWGQSSPSSLTITPSATSQPPS